MYKKFALVLTLFIMTVMAVAASGTPDGQRVVLQTGSDFSALAVEVPATVELVCDPDHSGYVVYHTTAPESQITAENRGGVLKLGVKRGVRDLKITSRIVVVYGNTAPRTIVASSTGDVLAKKLETASSCALKVEGTGNIKIDALAAAGGVTIKLDGTGNVKIGQMKAPSVTAQLNGTGNILVPAAPVMTLQNNGTGNIIVSGNATGSKVNVSRNGTGDVKFMKR